VKEEDSAKVEALILETMERLEKEGFTQTAVEAAVNTIEFSLRCGGARPACAPLA
jgi:Zn-dependent M16 (insulinase) family peptidase